MEVSGTGMLRLVWLVVFCLGASAWGCDSLSTRRDDATTTGDLDPCAGEPELTQLQWEEDSELGTPAHAFAGIEGQCAGALRWSDAAAETDRASSMHVEVQLNHGSPRLVQHTDRKGKRNGCPVELEVDAHVDLHSDDAAVEAHEDTKVRYVPDAPLSFGFTLTRDEHRGTLPLQARKGETSMLSFELDGAGSNCAGEIMLTTTSTSGAGITRGSAGRIGAWSASGCPVGQQPFAVDEAISGRTLLEWIADTWDARELDGTWKDGAQTKLRLHVTPLTAASCAERRADMRVVTQPVEVRYSTDDGRLTERKTSASVRAQLTGDNELRELALWISDEMTCSSTNSQLDYTPTDCTQMKAATVQLGLSSSGEALDAISEGGLNIYFIPRFGDDPPERDTLSLQ